MARWTTPFTNIGRYIRDELTNGLLVACAGSKAKKYLNNNGITSSSSSATNDPSTETEISTQAGSTSDELVSKPVKRVRFAECISDTRIISPNGSSDCAIIDDSDEEDFSQDSTSNKHFIIKRTLKVTDADRIIPEIPYDDRIVSNNKGNTQSVVLNYLPEITDGSLRVPQSVKSTLKTILSNEPDILPATVNKQTTKTISLKREDDRTSISLAPNSKQPMGKHSTRVLKNEKSDESPSDLLREDFPPSQKHVKAANGDELNKTEFQKTITEALFNEMFDESPSDFLRHCSPMQSQQQVQTIKEDLSKCVNVSKDIIQELGDEMFDESPSAIFKRYSPITNDNSGEGINENQADDLVIQSTVVQVLREVFCNDKALVTTKNPSFSQNPYVDKQSSKSLIRTALVSQQFLDIVNENTRSFLNMKRNILICNSSRFETFSNSTRHLGNDLDGETAYESEEETDYDSDEETAYEFEEESTHDSDEGSTYQSEDLGSINDNDWETVTPTIQSLPSELRVPYLSPGQAKWNTYLHPRSYDQVPNHVKTGLARRVWHHKDATKTHGPDNGDWKTILNRTEPGYSKCIPLVTDINLELTKDGPHLFGVWQSRYNSRQLVLPTEERDMTPDMFKDMEPIQGRLGEGPPYQVDLLKLANLTLKDYNCW